MSDTILPHSNIDFDTNIVPDLSNKNSHDVGVKKNPSQYKENIENLGQNENNDNKVVKQQNNNSVNVDNNVGKDREIISNQKEELESFDTDDASVLVIILQCETKPCDNNITNLKWVFSDPYFTVQVCAVDPPPNIPTTKTLSQTQYLENYCMRKALTYAANGPYLPNSQGIMDPQYWWNKIPVIIIKDSSISNIIPTAVTNEKHQHADDQHVGGMKKRIKTALDRAQQADLFFLCKWNDACNKYTDVTGVGNVDHGSTLKWSTQPTSTQAIMYTPTSRDYVRESLVSSNMTLSDFLNMNIESGQLLATVFVPNIIDYDIGLATSTEDYVKLNECAQPQTTTTSTSNTASIIWFAVVLALILIVAWIIIRVAPKYPISTGF